ncbi:hypothetical protein Tco_1082754 [Tanacetum coccineum]|uniref:Retrovirus-related Pol polyprotein from transposon TNT 1-94-like beta-barrel domain-containing protein n=1 Tax=Tanacetum coccineum TaxID=301880 RepID=A0ABQ5I1E6_9ASTR
MSNPANDDFSQHLSDGEESNHEDASDTGAAPKQPQPMIPQTTAISNIKLPILKKEEYDIWAMEMEHYLEYIDNEVWKVIQNGNSKKRISIGKDGVVRVLSPVTAAEIQAVEKERKAKNILLMAIPKEHMRRFHGMDDAKEIWEAIRTRFGGNANSKKMQKAVFKQQFEAFKISNSEGLEKGYDRFQQLLSQLEAHGAEVSTEDANHKFLRSLPSAWSNLAMTMRTNPEIDNLSIDDLYNLRVFEQKFRVCFKKTSSSAQMLLRFLKTNAATISSIEARRRVRVMERLWGNMMEEKRDSLFHIQKLGCREESDGFVTMDDGEAEVKRVVNTGNGAAKPVWTNTNRINHANQFVPRSVQLNTDRPKFNSVRPHINTGRTNINSVTSKVNSVSPKVNSVGPKVNAVNSKVNTDRPKQPVTNKTSNSSSPKRPQMNQMNQRRDFSKSYSSVRRPFAKSTAQMANSNAVMGSWGSAVKTSASYNWRNSRPNFNYNSGPTFIRTEHPLKNMVDRGIFDSGCSGHMTGNKDQLEDFEEFNGGSVTFGGSKGYISGKGRIRVGNLDFDSVSFVKELGHFNLFSISQICDKQHKVLFTETECLVVSSDFKMPDENQILLKEINSVMSDSDESGITYTEVSSPFEGLSDIGSPRADDHEYLELPGMPEDPYVEAALQAPPSPDYVPGPEEPEQAPPLPDYVPGPEHTDDEIVAEDQPDAEDASPTAQSLDYVLESDPEADPEEDDDEDPEEDPVDYSADGGDDGDDEDEPSEEDEDDDVDMEADEDEEEEEHPAPADSVVVALPATDQAPSAEETEPFETDESAATPPPHPAYRVTQLGVPTPAWSDAEIPSPSLPLSPPSPVLSPAPPPSPIRSLGYQAAMIRMRAEAASTSHSLPLPPPFILSPTRSDAPSSGIPPPLPISVPTSSPPLLLPSASRREDKNPEVTLPPRKRLGIALGPRYEVGESSSAAAARPVGGLRADYGFVATIDREIRHDP